MILPCACTQVPSTLHLASSGGKGFPLTLQRYDARRRGVCAQEYPPTETELAVAAAGGEPELVQVGSSKESPLQYRETMTHWLGLPLADLIESTSGQGVATHCTFYHG